MSRFTTGHRALLLSLVFFGLMVRAEESSPAEVASIKEYDLKAAYIFNFAKFTGWPSGGATGVPDPLVIGVLGDGRVAASLAALTRDRTISGSSIVVRSIEPDTVLPDACMVYVAASQDAALAKIAPTLFHAGRLTIGESDAFRDQGGIIRLVVQADRLQFEIDNGRAQKAGLTLSSQLLMLARRVY